MVSVITYYNDISCSIVHYEIQSTPCTVLFNKVVYYFTSAWCIPSNYVIWI